MKKILSVLCIALTLMAAHARTWEIKMLNTPTITIGGKALKVGDCFDEKDPIEWSSDKQAMKVVSNDKIYVLSKGLLSKRRAKTLTSFLTSNRSAFVNGMLIGSRDKTFDDYIISKKSASVRNDGESFPVTVEDHCALFEGDFVLLDSIAINVGWKTDESSYFEAQTTNLGEKNISFIIPAVDNVLTITRDVFSSLPSDCNAVVLSVKYVEKAYGEVTTVTDSMNVEIVPL